MCKTNDANPIEYSNGNVVRPEEQVQMISDTVLKLTKRKIGEVTVISMTKVGTGSSRHCKWVLTKL